MTEGRDGRGPRVVPRGMRVARRCGGANAAFALWLAMAGGGILALAACGPNAASLAQSTVAGPSGGSSTAPPGADGNVFGAYLAPRFAQSEHDYATASPLMRSVLTADPQNAALINRAFELAL